MVEIETEATSQEEIILKKGDTEVKILPQGAYIASFKVSQEEVLLPDQYFEISGSPKKRRGGIPLLFPQAGPITEKTDQFQLPQHGFARDKTWEIERISQEEGVLTLKLTSDEETRSMFPYDFEAEYTIEIDEGKLKTTLDITNNSNENLPIAPGFHPYIEISIDLKKQIETNIERFDPETHNWDKADEQFKDLPDGGVTIEIPGKGVVKIRTSEALKQLVLWTEEERPHICFEPWVGGANTILHEDQRINVPPGETTSLWMDMSFEKTQQ